ncbi:MAG: GNAT family N-acetyltransferase [Planctomycetes bacterium]|nr:GNAT family N-acetyltransferase [Planctomycetota bacterium]
MSEVTIYYLQMLRPPAGDVAEAPAGWGIDLVTPPDGAVNDRFYRRVGANWLWKDRLSWSMSDWHAYARREGLSTWIARLDDDEVGYAELHDDAAGSVQLCYFGLLPEHIGRGLGRRMLDDVLKIAWALPGTRRVWLHTCTNDHPHALSNYQARGFEIYHTRLITRPGATRA